MYISVYIFVLMYMENLPPTVSSCVVLCCAVCVLSVYGPGVFEQEYFLSKHFPSNMGKIWHDQWAFVEAETDRAVVLGEWGGHYENKDKQWQDALADYLVDRCLEDTFYWVRHITSYHIPYI